MVSIYYRVIEVGFDVTVFIDARDGCDCGGEVDADDDVDDGDIDADDDGEVDEDDDDAV